jgi:hypothetical protein
VKAAALLGLTVLVGSCDCRHSRSRAARDGGVPHRDDPSLPRRDPRSPPRDLPGPVRERAQLSVADATAAMPALPAARPLGQAAHSPTTDLVRFTYCVDAGGLTAAAEQLAAALRDDRWEQVTVRAPPDAAHGKGRYGIAAEKGEMRLAVTVQAVQRADCDAAAKQYFAIASMQRLR